MPGTTDDDLSVTSVENEITNRAVNPTTLPISPTDKAPEGITKGTVMDMQADVLQATTIGHLLLISPGNNNGLSAPVQPGGALEPNMVMGLVRGTLVKIIFQGTLSRERIGVPKMVGLIHAQKLKLGRRANITVIFLSLRCQVCNTRETLDNPTHRSTIT